MIPWTAGGELGEQVNEDTRLGHGEHGVMALWSTRVLTALKVTLFCDTVQKLCHPKHKRTLDQHKLQLVLAACFLSRTKSKKVFPEILFGFVCFFKWLKSSYIVMIRVFPRIHTHCLGPVRALGFPVTPRFFPTVSC